MRSPGYTDAEISAIGGCLKDGLSAGKIVECFHAEFRRLISRNAVVGIVNRNSTLKAIGFQRTGKGFAVGRKAGSRAVAPSKTSAAFARPAMTRVRPVDSARTVDQMICGSEAPVVAGAEPSPLAELGNRQCRFPVSGAGASTLFCASDVAPHDWMPGASGGCYCRLHRALAIRSEAA